MNCENCNKEHKGEYGSGRFCSSKCARGFSTKSKRKEINEKVSKTIKSKLVQKICKSCGSKVIRKTKTKYCLDCCRYNRYKKLFNKLNLVSDNLIELNSMAVEKLSILYFDLEYSLPMIKNEYNIQLNTIFNFMNMNGIGLRNLSDANTLSLKNKRRTLPENNTYMSGYHITWDNKKVYLRSSYEFDYAIKLDESKIEYEVEGLKIDYYDTIRKKNRIAIPDFYLVESNTIVEIKSVYTLNETNMRDKKKSYEQNGYNFKLILEKEEIEF